MERCTDPDASTDTLLPDPRTSSYSPSGSPVVIEEDHSSDARLIATKARPSRPNAIASRFIPETKLTTFASPAIFLNCTIPAMSGHRCSHTHWPLPQFGSPPSPCTGLVGGPWS